MPTLTTYRAAAAKLLGPFLTGTPTSGSTTTLLECTTWPFKSTLNQNDLYKDYYLMQPSAVTATDVSRIVDTYTAATGMFKPDQSFVHSPGVGLFELHGHPIEPSVALLDVMNTGLQRLMVPVEVSFTPTNGDIRQELTAAWPWLLDERWVYQAGMLYANESRRQVDPFLWHPLKGRMVKDGSRIYFEWGAQMFQGTELVYLRCIKRAYDHCLSGTTLVGAVTAATNATPIQLTVANHGLASNNLVSVASVGGNTNANGAWQVTVVDTSSFTLNGSSGNAAYTSGGTVAWDYGRTSGLTLEADTCPVAAEWLAAAAAVIAWDRYGHLLEQTASAKLIRDAQKAAAWFDEVTEYNFQEWPRTLQPVHAFGPPRYGLGWGWW